MNDFLQKWCDERHNKIDKEFGVVWKKFGTIETRLWGMIILQLIILGSIIGVLLK